MCSSDLEGVLGGQLPEVLHQVEGEAVVVIEDQQHGRGGSRDGLMAQLRPQGGDQQQQSDHQRGEGGDQHGGRGAVLGNPR